MTPFLRNVPLLALSQALMLSGNSLIIATSALVGLALAADKSWATLPLAAQFIAAMLTSIPASLFMDRFGRKQGFLFAVLFGAGGAIVATLAIIHGEFWWFFMAAILFGIFNGFGSYYRFAAADAVDTALKGRAVSYVLAGGVVAAVVGPNLANWTRESIVAAPFAGAFASMIVIYALAFLTLSFIRLPPKPVRNDLNTAPAVRSLRVIACQPAFIVALICGMLGYGVMAFVMTATPLAMQHHAHNFSDTSFVIQWHVLGMFAPSFFTGHLIRRFGMSTILLVGAILGLLCVFVNLHGVTVMHYWASLLLLGISWNFLFIGATTLLTETYRPEERAKTQAANDFAVFSAVSAAVLSAGALHHHFGWQVVNISVIPLLLLILISILWLRKYGDRKAAECQIKATEQEGRA